MWEGRMPTAMGRRTVVVGAMASAITRRASLIMMSTLPTVIPGSHKSELWSCTAEDVRTRAHYYGCAEPELTIMAVQDQSSLLWLCRTRAHYYGCAEPELTIMAVQDQSSLLWLWSLSPRLINGSLAPGKGLVKHGCLLTTYPSQNVASNIVLWHTRQAT